MCCSEHDYLVIVFFFSSRRRHTRFDCDWSSDVCSSDLAQGGQAGSAVPELPLAHDLTGGIEKADLMLLRAPIDASKPAYSAIGHDSCPPGCHEPPRRLPIRSEERRVGKEGRYRLSPDHL